MLSASDILKVNNLTKYFGGLAAVSNCSLKIKKGSITGIIGPNGSGKSTLFNLIAGNLKSSDGSVEFNNEDITDVPSYELFSKGLLRTFQIAHEFSNMCIRDSLSNELAGNLSGGQKKLLELGRTMMVDAKLVLLDEVGAGVNRTLLKEIGSSILRLNKEQGYTFCMIEHDMDFISRLCNPVIVMSEGSILFEGTADEVKKNEKVIESYLGRSNFNKDKI